MPRGMCRMMESVGKKTIEWTGCSEDGFFLDNSISRIRLDVNCV